MVRATIFEPRPLYTRGEAAEIRFEVEAAAPARMRFSADAGGHFVEREDRAFWAAGGGPEDDGAVDWPWWTGPVSVTVTAETGPGCVGEATVEIPLAGDVVMSDGQTGRILTYGSDGRYLGVLGQVVEGRGLGGLLALPPEAGGGLLVIYRPDRGDPVIKHLDRRGARVRDFEHADLASEPLWTHARPPRQLLWWPARGEILADGGARGRIHRFDPMGRYLGDLQVPLHNNGDEVPIGFALVDGSPIAGNPINERAYYLDRQPPEVLVEAGDGFDSLVGLATGHDGLLVALMRRGGNEFRAYAYDTRANERARTFLRAETRYLFRFLDGYLSVDLNGITLRDRELQEVEPGAYWDARAPVEIRDRAGIAWLD